MPYMKMQQMKPEFNSRRLLAITRSKGKMYEFSIPEDFHLSVPENSEPQELFLLGIGLLGNCAATLSESNDKNNMISSDINSDLGFSANFFDAFLQSRFLTSINHETRLLASSAYFLASRPGSSYVIARAIETLQTDAPVDKLVHWLLRANWHEFPVIPHPVFRSILTEIARLLTEHFNYGSGPDQLISLIKSLRDLVYEKGTAWELLLVDITAAILFLRLRNSSWNTLPLFTGIDKESWASAIQKTTFPKELWPSQFLLGEAGLFSGKAGIVQMPTSAGKTRSVEIIIRSAFLAKRTKLSVVVAPFRALCHEIGVSLRNSFSGEDVKVNELSDALQLDFLEDIAELLGSEVTASNYILVLTPEKFLYVLRQAPSILNSIGLVVYDEGHQFDTGVRGVTYELLLTEIKNLISPNSQTILISAVIQNAEAVAQWLIGDEAKVISGHNLLPTSRAVAYASWIEQLGQLMFYESGQYESPDYFVPRVIERQELNLKGQETKKRFFPEKDERKANDISLYLGIRLSPQGGVAIFCGQRRTAQNIAHRVVEIYERGFKLPSPAHFADSNELLRLQTLIKGHFGKDSVLSRAADLGVFVHHGGTPHGMRLAIEHSMQQGKINFIACTSTLAQGVNLPIRYLIVPSDYQAGERITARDFQNLMGRAGRSGMHTEGLVIFSNPDLFDTGKKPGKSKKFRSSTELLASNKLANTTSSILELFMPFYSKSGIKIDVPLEELCRILLSDEKSWNEWSSAIANKYRRYQFEEKTIYQDLKRRRKLIVAIESYLMANRDIKNTQEFRYTVEKLASSTLAYSISSDEIKSAITTLFLSIVDYLDSQEPSQERQKSYSKTLLGIKSAKEIEKWVHEKEKTLITHDTNEKWLEYIWDLFKIQSDNRFFHSISPDNLSFEITLMWISGESYQTIFDFVASKKGKKPWGDKGRSASLTETDIMNFCDGTLGFDCSLILAAVSQFLSEANSDFNMGSLSLFQKSLKYGLPDLASISCYETGFADRIVAQELTDIVRNNGFFGNFFLDAIKTHEKNIRSTLQVYPSYFESVLSSLI